MSSEFCWYSFVVTLNCPEEDDLLLPDVFPNIFSWYNLKLGNLKILTENGLTWEVTLEKRGKYFYFTKGWNDVVRQLSLTRYCILLFELNVQPAERSFTMHFMHAVQKNNICSTFCYYYEGLDYLVSVPSAFVQYHYREKKPAKLSISHPLMKTIEVNLDEKHDEVDYYYLTEGWSSVVNALNLKSGLLLVFKMQCTGSLRLSAYNVAGDELTLPLPSPSSPPPINENTMLVEPVQDEANFMEFHQKIDRRLRLTKPMMKFAGLKLGTKISIKFENNKQTKFLVTNENKNGTKRPVVENWNDFVKANNLHKGQECRFKLMKNDKLLIVSPL